MPDSVTCSFGGRTVEFDTSTVPQPVVESVFTHDLYTAERGSLEFILSGLNPDDVFFDVGAMYGLYTGFAGQVLTDGTVVAFEPYPRNLEALERTVELNGLSNVDIRDVALSDATGVEEFESPSLEYHVQQIAAMRARRQSGPESGATAPPVPDAGESVTNFSVETRPGDSLVEAGELPRPNVVKIDVEGAEPLVVDGLSETLTREACRLLVCEIHPPADERDDSAGSNSERSVADYDSTVDELVGDIERLGFETELEHGDGYLHLRGRKPSP
jgi:FkbM family methyltransferase